MSEKSSRTEPFAYILIVESDEDLRRLALQTIVATNCAVDVARDEDEAVYKAIQHRPQLIIIRQHEPIEIDPWNPPQFSVASQICRRARLYRSVRLVTHSDVALTTPIGRVVRINFRGKAVIMTPSGVVEVRVPGIFNPQICMMRPKFKGQDWRKEWFLYSSSDKTVKVLSELIPFLLGRTPDPFLSTVIHDRTSFCFRHFHRSVFTAQSPVMTPPILTLAR
jgi:CheY-like chemotaxis protein